MEAEQENNGDQNLLRNDLGDNRGTKIKREIPQLLIFNELRDSTVPRTATRILLEFTRKVSWRYYAKYNVIYLYISVLCRCDSNV